MINLEWYRSFIAVYRVGTVSGAAEVCFLTQPAVSQHVAALEKAVGAALFLRRPRRMVPTERGKELYTQIAQSFDKLEQTSQRLIGSATTENPLLRVGSPLEYFYEVMVERLPSASFRLWFEFDTAPNLAQRLEQNDLDVIVTPQRTPSRTINYQYLTEESFWLVGSPQQKLPIDPLLSENLDAFEAWLVNQRWISYGVELPIIRRFWQQIFHHRPDFQPILVMPNLHTIIKAVELGYGLSILPDYLCRRGVEAKRLKRLWSPPSTVSNELWFGFRSIDRSNLTVKEFRDSLTHHPSSFDSSSV